MPPDPPAAVRAGTQGWNYPDWAGSFYPAGTRPQDFLRLYARAFDTVEVDSTFYAVPPESTVRGWVERTPPGFRFALKVPRAVTHDARLRDAEGVLEEFVERARGLGDRMGPILIQLPPDLTVAERPALEALLPRLPPDLRFAVEFRDAGWITREVYDLLAMHNVALALSDGPWVPRRWLLSLAPRPTADFHYVRWMGPDRRLTRFDRVQVERDAELDAWVEALRDLPSRGVPVYAYFSNYFEGHAPASARALQRRLGVEPVPPDRIGDQVTLF